MMRTESLHRRAEGMDAFPSVAPSAITRRRHATGAQWLSDHLKRLGFEARLVDIGGQPIIQPSKKGRELFTA